MKKIYFIFLLIFFPFSIVFCQTEKQLSQNEYGAIFINSDNTLIFKSKDKEIILQNYYSEDNINAFLYKNIILFSGGTNIGLYVFNIETSQKYLLNSLGSMRSSMFYYDFKENLAKIKVTVGLELASMPKFCIYDLEKLSIFIANEDILQKLEINEDSISPSLYNFTKKNNISYCTLEDNYYYYDFLWLKNDQISFNTCENNDFCEYDNFAKSKKHIIKWDELQKFTNENILLPIFSDISPTHSLYSVTKTAHLQGWLTGYPDGTLRPQEKVNRAEFGKMEMKAFGMGEGKSETLKKFPDTTITEWYTPYVSKAVELGIMKGYTDGKMKPENSITVAEGVKMTIETMKQKRPELFTTQNFPTISSFSLNLTPRLSSQNTPWYTEYMEQAKTLFENIEFLNHPDLDPNRPMTRGECIELISVGLEKMGE